MIPNLFENIVNNISNNQGTGFLGFVASFFISVFPSCTDHNLLVQMQPTDYTVLGNLILMGIQAVAGLLGIALSGIMLYINFPKLTKMFKKRKAIQRFKSRPRPQSKSKS